MTNRSHAARRTPHDMTHHPDAVILLHGLTRTARSMNGMARALAAHGFAVVNQGYPSRHKPIEALAPLAIEQALAACRKGRPARIHFVTHSLGGILVRQYLAQSRIPELGRVVMLGPPNQGSEVVDRFSVLPGFAQLNGPAGLQLGTGPDSIPNRLGPVDYPVGVIAGTRSVNPILSTAFAGRNDGKVSVQRARVDGMADFIEVATSHPFMMRNRTVVRQTIEFLRHGRFGRGWR